MITKKEIKRVTKIIESYDKITKEIQEIESVIGHDYTMGVLVKYGVNLYDLLEVFKEDSINRIKEFIQIGNYINDKLKENDHTKTNVPKNRQ